MVFSAALVMLLSAMPVDPASTPTAVGPAQADTLRAFQPQDLFRLHRIGEVRFSPDGGVLAFERARSGEEGAIARLPERPEFRSDIWIVAEGEDTPRRLTDGASAGAGWFHPRWSPTGDWLAFLSIEGNRIRAWVWERASDEIRPVTDRAVHLTSAGPLAFQWLSDGELAVALRPEGAPERHRMLAENTRPGSYAVERWEAAWSGRNVTADVLDADPDVAPRNVVPRTEVTIYDLEGSSEATAEGRFGLAWPSPDGRWLATFSEPPVGTVPPDQPMHQWARFGTRPGAVSLTGEDPPEGAPSPEADAIHQPLYNTLQWAPDGREYAFVFQPFPDDDGSPGRQVGVYRPAVGDVEVMEDLEAPVRALAWTGDSRLLVLAERPSADRETSRPDWWHLSPEGEWQNLTAAMGTVPDDLVPADDGAVGLADGTLWKIGVGEEPEALIVDEDATLHTIMWPSPSGFFAGGPTSLRAPDEPIGLLASSDSGRSVLVVEIVGADVREVARVPVPPGEGSPADVAPETAAAAFSRSDDTGTWLFRQLATSPNSPVVPDTLVAEDRWLAEVDPGETRRLEYEGPEGEALTAWMILPPGREDGQAHPTVVSFYPGTTHGEREPAAARLNRPFGIVALQLLASRGYAVLLPSVPLEPDAPPRPDLARWILPAVDEAVDAGLAEPTRLGVMGHSYGGYGVNHLVSQTDRFQAALSSAGPTHLRSHYGTLDARGRYGHMAPPEALQLSTMGYFESGQGRMGAPPFRAPERYREASPLTYVAEVDTPLLMIHGDQDFVPIQQAEMFFAELLRQGNRARLVRYSGEGHTVSGRANVLDMWEQIFRWWEEFLGEG